MGKINEIKAILKEFDLKILSFHDFNYFPEIVEDGHNFLENAFKKARVVSKFTGEAALADDSGLEVDCINGEPGVHSSRYAGENATDEENIKKLLDKLSSVPEEMRKATFKCVLVLYHPNGTFESFNGILKGLITDKPRGEGGFGYDPVFLLPDRGLTLAELSDDEKNNISHRAMAVNELKKSLQKKIYS